MPKRPNIELSDKVLDFFSAALYSRRWTNIFASFEDGKFYLEQIKRGETIGAKLKKKETRKWWNPEKYKKYFRTEPQEKGKDLFHLSEEGKELQDISRFVLIQEKKLPRGADVFKAIDHGFSAPENFITTMYLLYTLPITKLTQLHEYMNDSTAKRYVNKLCNAGLLNAHFRTITPKRGGSYKIKILERTSAGAFYFKNILLPILEYASAEDKKDTEIMKYLKFNWPLKPKRPTRKVAKPVQSDHRIGMYIPDRKYSQMLVEKLRRTVFGTHPEAKFVEYPKGLDHSATQNNIVFFDADSVSKGMVARVIADIKRTMVKDGRTKVVALTDHTKLSDRLSMECDLVFQKHWLDDGNGYKEESDAFLNKYAQKLTARKKSGPGGIVMGTEQFIIS